MELDFQYKALKCNNCKHIVSHKTNSSHNYKDCLIILRVIENGIRREESRNLTIQKLLSTVF